jgi:hypothetical protein
VRNSTAQEVIAVPSAQPDLSRGVRQVLPQGAARIRLVDGAGPAAEMQQSSAAMSEAELVIRAEALAEARRMTDGISGVLALLRNLDRLAPGEPEHVRIEEIAALFADISDFAAYGARQVRQAADAIRLAAKADRA